VIVATIAIPLAAQIQVTKESVTGITNLVHIPNTVACAGAVTPAAVVEIKKMGYKSIINLRQASEAGADIEGSTAAAKAAGITYIHLPFNAASPDPMLVERFIKAVTDSANQPAFIHCASGNRAATLWLIKRVQVDKWDVNRAVAEAEALGMSSGAMKKFALDYIESHK
jgi:uncharacterized protein (TIGR01244 family)